MGRIVGENLFAGVWWEKNYSGIISIRGICGCKKFAWDAFIPVKVHKMSYFGSCQQSRGSQRAINSAENIRETVPE